MVYLWATILVVANAVWLFLNLLGLPGNWLMVASTALVAWLYWDQRMIGRNVLIGPPAEVMTSALVREIYMGFRADDAS